MVALVRYRILLWLTALAVGPALALDLADPRTPPTGVWAALGVVALWFGAPYYLAQVVLGALLRLPGAPGRGLDLAAALVVAAVGMAAHAWLSRRVRRRESRFASG